MQCFPMSSHRHFVREHAKILRVPFRSKAGILRKWISR